MVDVFVFFQAATTLIRFLRYYHIGNLIHLAQGSCSRSTDWID